IANRNLVVIGDRFTRALVSGRIVELRNGRRDLAPLRQRDAARREVVVDLAVVLERPLDISGAREHRRYFFDAVILPSRTTAAFASASFIVPSSLSPVTVPTIVPVSPLSDGSLRRTFAEIFPSSTRPSITASPSGGPSLVPVT